jgi:hypothetical protein
MPNALDAALARARMREQDASDKPEPIGMQISQ